MMRGEGEGCKREPRRGREVGCSWNSSQEEKMEGVQGDIMNREGRVDKRRVRSKGGSWRREGRKRGPKGRGARCEGI